MQHCARRDSRTSNDAAERLLHIHDSTWRKRQGTHPVTGKPTGFLKPPAGGMSCRKVVGGGLAISEAGH